MNQANQSEVESGVNQKQQSGLSRCFFGQSNALKIQYSDDSGSIYISIGTKSEQGQWSWRAAKLKDVEAGDILRVLQGISDNVSFYHKFKGNSNRISINRKDASLFIRIEDFSKALNTGEQQVLLIFLEQAIRNYLKSGLG